VPVDEEQEKEGSGKIEVGRSLAKAVDAYFGRFHY